MRNRLLICIIFSLAYLGLRQDNSQSSDRRKLEKMVFGTPNISYDDPRLLTYIRNFHTTPPLLGNDDFNFIRPIHPLHRSVQSAIWEKVGVKRGFFVECGANDGEFLSNTLYLELKKQWTGILIEPSPTHFSVLKQRRSRNKAWLVDACLTDHPAQLDLFKDTVTNNPWSQGGNRLESEGKSGMDKQRYLSEGKVDCFPLGSILKALNVTTVNFLSLDVEGNEYKVLSVFPFDEIEVQVILVEHMNIPEGKEALEILMESKGYEQRESPQSEADFLFVKA